MKDKEDKIIPQRKLRKYNIEDEENTSLSKEYKKKKMKIKKKITPPSKVK